MLRVAQILVGLYPYVKKPVVCSLAPEQKCVPPSAVALRPSVGHDLLEHTQHCTIVSRTHLDQ